MITISKIVKDGILEIKLPDNTAINKKYKIIDDAETCPSPTALYKAEISG